MKFFLGQMAILLSLLWMGSAYAQELNITAPEKNLYYYRPSRIDTMNIEPGSAGRGVVWDFSKVSFIDSGDIRFYTGSMDNPFAELFPTANFLCYGENATDILFLRREPNCLIQIGGVDIEDSIVVHHANAGSDTLLNYPLFYGKKWEFKTTKEEKNTSVNANAPNAIQYIQGTFEVDGEGVIMLPDGKKYNALRLHTTMHFDGYAYEVNPQQFKFRKVTQRERYQWFIQEQPVYEAFFINYEHTDFYNAKNFKYKSSSKKKNMLNMPIDLNSSFKPNSTIQLTVTDQAIAYTLSSSAAVKINIFNAEGKVVKHLERNKAENIVGRNTMDHMLHELPPGLYIIALYSENGTDMVKWMNK